MSETFKDYNYWRSLNQLAHNKEYRDYLEREFPENVTELTDQVSRRGFLRVMGASIALAGFAACRRPVQKIIPYNKSPEEVVEGQPNYYATAMPFQDSLMGLVIETHEGRPTKAEGNKDHPASKGNTGIYQQASILNLYDPDRSRYIRNNGERASWNDFLNHVRENFTEDSSIAVLSEANSSPTFQRLRRKFLEQFPNAQWVTYEPYGEENIFEGHKQAFGERLRVVKHFDQADVVLSLDDDFMSQAGDKNAVANIKRFTDRRKVRSTRDDMNRLYMVENDFSLTGSNADNRLRMKAGNLKNFVMALAAALAEDLPELSAYRGYMNEMNDHPWIASLKKQLLDSQGTSMVTAGQQHDPSIHATVAAINKALGNAGQTVTYLSVPHAEESNQELAFANLVDDMRKGNVDNLVMLGTNPVFTAPADLNFDEALNQVGSSIHLSEYYDETSKLATWHINKAHFMESWGDGYSYEGTRSVIQPLIAPLFSGKNEIEVLNTLASQAEDTRNAHKLVRETFGEYYTTGFENKWRQILHDGVDTENHFEQRNPELASGFPGYIREETKEVSSDEGGIELVMKPDYNVFDGRFANNGWLQELPHPMTKITWDNVALMSPATAQKLGMNYDPSLGEHNQDVVRINASGTTIEIAAWILPGHADDSITVTVGQGRRKMGRVANKNGTDTYPLKTTQHSLHYDDVEVQTTDRTYTIASTQDHHTLEGRGLVRQATIGEYRKNPDFSSYKETYGNEVPGTSENMKYPLPLFDAHGYPDYEPQWGMSIDLNSCIGCGVCTIACQAENNIPVVGKREVSRGREMHWIRTDRYFVGEDTEDPQAVHQPVPCMHCELAPCEQVCPVAATTHSDDGMNQMTYNRCIGTRYCSNNCPYKVRRFNFFNYSQEYLTQGDDPEIVQMAMNPNVSIRFRGVMEKCTYCVQRVNRAKINTKNETGDSVKPPANSVETACQQACPAEAITFGDITNKDSDVVADKDNERSYLMLEELNTRPRTSYMAKLKNPDDDLVNA